MSEVDFLRGEPRFLSLAKSARIALDAKIAEIDSGDTAALLAVYREIEEDSRKYPHSEERLMKAVLAGERILSMVSLGGADLEDVWSTLAASLVRRSKWVAATPMSSDFDLAIGLMEGVLERTKTNKSRIIALQKLSVLSEEKYERTNDEQDLRKAIQYLETAASLTVDIVERGFILVNAKCLRFKIETDVFKTILAIPIRQLPYKSVSFASAASKRFRFIDARSLAAGTNLQVLEFDVLPRQRYVALSYVWRGSHVESDVPPPLGKLSIDGVVGADPISIDVLVSVCKCVMMLGCDLLWIDGVCIIQNNDEDKGWQIQNMFDIYKHCKVCLVLPGGLSRLVPLHEPTSWIHRAWTLQEAVAPDQSVCLFSWTKGSCILQANSPCVVTEVEPGKAARADLRNLLMTTLAHSIRISATSDSQDTITIKMLADTDEKSQVCALLGAIDYRGREGMNNAVWKCAHMRVASRPADAVFSIMGLFGVVLDPLKFEPEDRKGATIALMKAVLGQGQRAEWLGIVPQMDINVDVPSLPIFPFVNSQGKVLVATENEQQPISTVIGDSWWYLTGAPKGKMQDDGALILQALAIPIRRIQGHAADLEIRAGGSHWWDGRPLRTDPVWYISASEHGPPYALQIGRKERYLNPAVALMQYSQPYIFLLTDEADNGAVRVTGFATGAQAIIDTKGWTEEYVIIAAATN